MGVLRVGLIVLCGLSFSGMTCAIEVAKEFSAQAVQQAPGRPVFQAQMYVSKEAVRTDSKVNNTDIIEIVYPAKFAQVLLIPGDKIYLERKSDKAPAAMAAMKDSTEKPCAGRPDTKCTLVSKETINGRKTEKWEFIATQNGRSLRSLHWIDEERRMPVREFYPDGTVTELKILGQETINGRKTEKWSMLMTRADGQSMESTQWYDPELKIAIREEMPGGYIRELRNINTGSQKKSLFEIPKDFHKVDQLPAYLVPPQAAPGARRE